MASNESNDKGDLMEKLRTRLQDVTPIPEEPDFFTKEETLMRFLKARNWDLKEAEKQLRNTIEWRREHKPLTTDCRWCHENPGTHSMRQVGFDELGRPVLYSCFAQARTKKNGVEDSVAHCTYLIENAKRSMKEGVGTWVFIIDCTGMSISVCDTKMSSGVTDVFGTYYPERLGKIVCINHNPIFHGLWQAVKVFIDPNTVAKMKLVRKKEKFEKNFKKLFSEELTEWLLEEIRLNRQEPLSDSQVRFWEAPKTGEHDPRGCPSYVAQFVAPFCDGNASQLDHLPHPNIVDKINGKSVELRDFDMEKREKKREKEETERKEEERKAAEKKKKKEEEEERKKKAEEEKEKGSRENGASFADTAAEIFSITNIVKKFKTETSA